MAHLAHGQIVPLSNFDDGNPTLQPTTGILSATLSATTKDQDCAGSSNKARKLSNSISQTFTITVVPVATWQMTITSVQMKLKLSGGNGLGTASATVDATSFGSASVTNVCSTPNFTGTPVVSSAAVTITITVSGYGSSESLTIDDILVDGSVIQPVLPVELSKFNVKKTEQSVMLAWATASEKNNDHFDIQKSTNGTQFQTIGQVKGSGTNLSGASYNFEDKNPSVGIAYYRLKQVDSDGKYEFSSVRSIMFGKSKIAVFSTIAKDRISLTVSDDQIVPFDIINLNGQKVLAGKAIGQYTIDVSSLHSGMYFIRTEGGEVTRFVKE